MLRSFTIALGISCLSLAHAAGPEDKQLEDPYFGEALYYAYQGEFFDAIARLDTELGQYYGLDQPELDSLYSHIDSAEFSVGDFELSYRMHQRAGRAIEAVIEGNVPEAVRNTAAYRLARIYFQKDQPVNAFHALERIEGEVPRSLRDEVEFLRAQIAMRSGRFSDAVETLKSLQGTDQLQGFAAYNLGVALFGAGREDEAFVQLDKAGLINSDQRAVIAIRDKANLVLGTRLLEDERADEAKIYLDRVRLDGPFSNRALLGSGWADTSRERFRTALVPWSILVERDPTNKAVQEALLALPYAYGKLDFHGKAALAYGRALDIFGNELDKLNASIESIRTGKFLEAMVREEVRKDKNWVVNLRELPETPETYYLTELMASHDFQSSLQNYLDLEDLRERLASWESSLNAWEEIIQVRRRYYEPLLPDIDKQFRRLDAQMRLRVEQRDHLNNRLQSMLVAPRPGFLATTGERIILQQIAHVESQLKGGRQQYPELYKKITRLKGILTWRFQTEYDERLTEAHEHLRELDKLIVRLQKQYDSFVRTRQAARQSYEGYDQILTRLRAQRARGYKRVEILMARQGHMLETLAVDELQKRRERLQDYQIKARFALADSYDRATKAQTEKAVEGLAGERGTGQPDDTGGTATTENEQAVEQPVPDEPEAGAAEAAGETVE